MWPPLRLIKGDIIAGFFTDQNTPFLLYWMEITEVLNYDDYFNDSRFQKKKPNLKSRFESKCGDNIYYRDNEGNWRQVQTLYHSCNEQMCQDTRNPVVYIGKIFSYFGKNAYCKRNELPKKLSQVLKKGQGVQYTCDSNPLSINYISWLKSMDLGRHGNPRDMNDINSCKKHSGKKCKI